MVQIEPALGWSVVVVLAGLVFAAGGAWFRLGMVKRLDEDLRQHMKEEVEWRMEHIQHGGHGIR